MPTLIELASQIERCQDCELGKHRTRAVPGDGAEDARIVFIGEAPGWYEDQQGRPFVGPAGQFLDELLASIELKRNQVYICNILKCRPPENRDPLPPEISACQKWLDQQIEAISPKMIVTLGRLSMAKFFPGESISKLHGTSRKRDGIIYFAMYHPAAALHQQKLRSTIIEDMRKIPQFLDEALELKEEEKAQQLPMF